MPPARLDPADQRPVGRYVLARPDRGCDVPVAEFDASAGQDANDVRWSAFAATTPDTVA